MAILIKAPATRTRGGGATLRFCFVEKQPDGTFDLPAATDPYGAVAGTWHSLGSLTKTTWSYNEDNSIKVSTEAIEMDLDRRNALNILAPPLANTDKIPDLKLEDGTKLEGDAGGDGNTDKPFVALAYFGKAISGKKNALIDVSQVTRSGGSESDSDNWSKHKFEFSSVNGYGYEPEFPDPDDDFDDLVAPELSGNNRFGVWIAEP